MITLQSFLGFLSLEVGLVFMVLFDITHLLWHFTLFLPADRGRNIYIFYEAFDIDADLFLFFTTNLALLLIKIVYGLKVIQHKFKSYTHTYEVLTQLIMLLVCFLDLALTIYLTHQIGNWHGWPFLAGLLLISIYFIILSKSLATKVKAAKEAAKAAQGNNSPLMEAINNEEDSEGEDIREDNGEINQTESARKRV